MVPRPRPRRGALQYLVYIFEDRRVEKTDRQAAVQRGGREGETEVYGRDVKLAI